MAPLTELTRSVALSVADVAVSISGPFTVSIAEVIPDVTVSVAAVTVLATAELRLIHDFFSPSIFDVCALPSVVAAPVPVTPLCF